MTPLQTVHRTFLEWFGDGYDLDAINVVLATAAVAQLTGDPIWTLLISGPGNAKTETVSALGGAGAIVTSTITSEGALLSATPKKETTKDATGGLLRRLGANGILVIKDVTSILSMNRDTRAGVLGALREVHDGRWERNVGTNGGRALLWTGRIAVIGACTTVWDRAHDVVSAMGDRFVVVRVDSDSEFRRRLAGYQAIANTGREDEMREALASSVTGVLRHVDPLASIHATPAETDQLFAAANLVTRCRTAVDYDYRGDVVDAHAIEAPTRFAKQLDQVMRGAVAVGLERRAALRLALRCARDSMPPLRLAILEDVAAHPHTRTHDVRQRLNKPRATIDRQLQALHMLGVLDCEELEDSRRDRSTWYYQVVEHIDPSAIRVPDLSPTNDSGQRRERIPTDISGTRKLEAVS